MEKDKQAYYTKLLRDSGMRMTTQRKEVLSLLGATDYSLSIKDLYEGLLDQGVKIDEASVYRIVHAFKSLGIVHTQTDGTFKLCTHHACEHEFHISVQCDLCHKVTEPHFNKQQEKKLASFLGIKKEDIQHVQVSVRCKECD